jgi:hypothetical protein
MGMALEIGELIGVPCKVRPGPFTGEHLITFEAVQGPVSGFVRDSELRQEEGQWYVRARILAIESNELTVQMWGSFFTTNGLATVSRDLALAA